MKPDAFQVSLGSHLLSGFVRHTSWLWKLLGNLETATVRSKLEPVSEPVWVSGIARAGSTIVLEILASHPTVATHQYRDFPFLAIPYWWRTTLDNAKAPDAPAEERAHGDRLQVTPKSPEAMEEPLWMMFFDGLHDPTRTNVLGASTSMPKFESFYREHIQKLLLVTGRDRYVAKGNYNTSRLGYLQKMFADARFVVPIRNPHNHIASLRKQHRLFCANADEYPRSVAHLDRVGHYEFGVHRRAINCGDRDVVASIEELWESGEDVRGWARYWAHVYGFVADQQAQLGAAPFVVRYEDLCGESALWLERIFDHTGLSDGAGAVIDEYRDRLSRPTYYEPDFSADERQAIAEECAAVGERFGYDVGTTETAVATTETGSRRMA